MIQQLKKSNRNIDPIIGVIFIIIGLLILGWSIGQGINSSTKCDLMSDLKLLPAGSKVLYSSNVYTKTKSEGGIENEYYDLVVDLKKRCKDGTMVIYGDNIYTFNAGIFVKVDTSETQTLRLLK